MVMETYGIGLGTAASYYGEGIVAFFSRDEESCGGFGERNVDNLAFLSGDHVWLAGFSWREVGGS